MKGRSRREFLKLAAQSLAVATATITAIAATQKESESVEPAPFANKAGDLIHPYCLERGWRKTFFESDLEIAVWDSWRCKWLSLMTIPADDIEKKRAIWSG